jgi:hypothetical protein
MITAISASHGSASFDSWNACAVPLNEPWIDAGMPIPSVARSIDATAWLSETPGAALNEITVAGNWPWCPTESATADGTTRTSCESGTCAPVPEAT